MRHNFRELTIWKVAMEIAKEVYLLSSAMSTDEKFGLISQMNRSAVSIPSSIAEGSGRTSDKEFAHFLNISLASSYELETQLILTAEIYHVETDKLVNDLKELQKMIGGFKRKLKSLES
jgi:four helix bundle protein